MNKLKWLVAATVAVVAACVTINVYFPEASAERAADRIIDEVRGSGPSGGDTEPSSNLAPDHPAPRGNALAALGALLVPAAHAQSQPDFDASSPATRALTESLRDRYRQLKPHFESGALGLSADATIEIRDRGAIPLNERNRVRQLVSEQNADWEALYREIARLNGRPEWLDRIREVFAERWIAKADAGWYYRDESGNWRRK